MKPTISFSAENNAEFAKTLKKRVNEYFKTNNIKKTGNYTMYIKAFVMLALYLTPYFFILFGHIESKLLYFGLWIIMGFGMVGIGTAVMHDANHGVFSSNQKVNEIMGGLIYFAGGNALNWKIQHNVLHHTYTNVDGYDHDIDSPANLFRFSPHQKLSKIHRFQYIYAWFLYSLLTISWAFDADFKQIVDFKKKGLTKVSKKSFGRIMTDLIFFKLLYYGFIFALPIIISAQPWWMTILAFIAMHMLAGLLLSSIFQLAHVVPTSEFPLPNDEGQLENSWLVHQLHTTADFSKKDKIFTWYAGGLNFQVEHHLFPNICHIHYSKIAKIVKETAEEYKIPYHSYSSFWTALGGHIALLKRFGRPELQA